MKIWPWSVIAELRTANVNLNYRLGEWEDQWKERHAESTGLRNQIEYLVRAIRDMDDQIFKMSQASSWEAMRPNFNNLQEGMMVRKRQESDRINDLIRPELIKTYGPKRLGGPQ